MKLIDADFPREVRERMQKVLMPGDEVLWAARPVAGWNSRFHEFGNVGNAGFMLLFALLWCGGCSVFLYAVFVMLMKGEKLSQACGLAAFLLPFVTIAVLLLRTWCRVLFRGNTCFYAITRHFLLIDARGRLEALLITPDMIRKTEIYARGQGHIFLKSEDEREGLFYLPDVRAAVAVLHAAAAGSREFPEPPPVSESALCALMPEPERHTLQYLLEEGESALWVAPGVRSGFFWKSWGYVLFMLLFAGAMLYDYRQGSDIPGLVWGLFGLCMLILVGVVFSLYLRLCRKNCFSLLTNRRMGMLRPGGLSPLAKFRPEKITIDARGNVTLSTAHYDMCYPGSHPGLLPQFFYHYYTPSSR